MGSFKNPVGSSPPDPYEKYRTEEVQREKQLKEERKKEREKDPKGIFYLAIYMLSLFRKIIHFFEPSREKKLPSEIGQTSKKHLLQFREALDRLKKEDLSQDIDFLNRLSENWHLILQDLMQFPKNTLAERSLKALLHSIQDYPHKQEHTFGYYLTEYAGQKWLPFPYMEMIHKLHQDHQKKPTESMLFFWTQELQLLLTALDSL